MTCSVNHYTTDRDGTTYLDPSVQQMREVLESIDDPRPDHPEVWLSHYKSGWCLSVFPGGVLHLENDICNQAIRQLKYVKPTKVLELWLRLARGEIDQLLMHSWQFVS